MSNDESAVPRLVAIDRQQLFLRTVDVEKLVEQEHAANRNPVLSKKIDSNYPADYQKINERCHPQIEQTSAPIVGELTPP